MKDKINSAVKYRESYRPFAPVCLEEDLEDLMQTHGQKEIRFMEMALEWNANEKRFPAVIHEDGTGRVQTVGRDSEQPMRTLLEKYKELTGLPVLLNTSFNLNDEPIVNTPEQAVRTFFSSGIDVLSMGKFLIYK
jgi:carbamoyltransferase